MALGRRKPKQTSFWVETSQLQAHGRHPFYSRLNEILDRAKWPEQVEADMLRLGLGKPWKAGDQSALRHLQDAYEVFRRPVGKTVPSAVLIPLRSCIDEILNKLLAGRSIEGYTGDKTARKVRAILAALSADGVTDRLVDYLAGELAELKSSDGPLHGSKSKEFDRDAIGTTLRRSVAWIGVFLRFVADPGDTEAIHQTT